jgi:hypothetical protein
MMQKQFKQLVLLAALVPTFAMAQALSNSAPAATAAAAPIDADKKAAIKDLLTRRRAEARVGNRQQRRDASEATVPAILSDALSENKTLNDKQKQAAVPTLQRTQCRSWSTARARPSARAVPERCDVGSVRRVREVLQHVGDQGPDDVL